MVGFQSGSEEYDFRGDEEEAERSDIGEVVEKLRETLTHDMALKAYRMRHGSDPKDDELENFMEELVNEHYNAGLDEWDDDFLYYD